MSVVSEASDVTPRYAIRNVLHPLILRVASLFGLSIVLRAKRSALTGPAVSSLFPRFSG